ncbi:uncharacterized protein EI90DRAFT_3035459 [Cantharellus anzutake]|uniref:uncharacterized protein n=1 Tax=Cantharellus anzutake TaxID=1750568 RepID=UPI00190610E5|nr:uncharacterized protein EI90DRAFT_3088247 [Cantharellus anzutake]XP_038921773.1 uncharacterized protein EI90DRAFT_3035459 [Cantharellus anzutake]KAF8315477.1 hypothetical protein EI90DRAFT_3088247 [Cantharellus anzutake]KAF8340411.1 hypothetical protein EI90DRAFT_3035459 [Cantharellus anzutake]
MSASPMTSFFASATGLSRPALARATPSQSLVLVKSLSHRAGAGQKRKLIPRIVARNIAKALKKWKPFTPRAASSDCSECNVSFPSVTDVQSHTSPEDFTFASTSSSEVSTPDECKTPPHAIEISFSLPSVSIASSDSESSAVKDTDLLGEFEPLTNPHAIKRIDTHDIDIDDVILKMKVLKEPELPETPFSSFSAWEIPTILVTPSTPTDSVETSSLFRSLLPVTLPPPSPTLVPALAPMRQPPVLIDIASPHAKDALSLPNICINQWVLLWRLYVLEQSDDDLLRPVESPWEVVEFPGADMVFKYMFTVALLLLLVFQDHFFQLMRSLIVS